MSSGQRTSATGGWTRDRGPQGGGVDDRGGNLEIRQAPSPPALDDRHAISPRRRAAVGGEGAPQPEGENEHDAEAAGE